MKIYFDNAASTKILDDFKKTYLEILDDYANPSSIHSLGKKSRYELEKARNLIADILNVKSSELVFTSGATELNNQILKAFETWHIITSKIEHPSILNVCKYLEEKGTEITYLDVNEHGYINLDQLKSSIKENTKLVSIMAVNNETGVRQVIEEIGEFLKDKDIYFHSDITQMLMKEKVDIQKLNLDFFSASFHKFHGPKGLGLTYIKDGIVIEKLLHGGSQEKNKRSGTENYHSIIFASKVMKYMNDNLDENLKYIKELKEYFLKSLEKFKDKIKINNSVNVLDHFLNIQIKGKQLDYLLPLFDLNGIYISGGSACQSGVSKSSTVLLAQGLSENEANSSIRISLSIENTKEEIDYFILKLEEILE